MAGTAVSRGVPREITLGRSPVPVIGANEIPRIQYSTGAARALQQFSRDMFSLSDSFQDQLDDQAEAEATSQGAIQGATGDFELQTYGTIRGRAFNKAAIESFVTTIETQSIYKVAELSQQFGSDPVKLEAALRDWGNGAASEIEKVYPPAAAAFRQRTAIRSMPAVEAARDARYALTRSEADAALIENEIALNAEISASAVDLFSDNPERSQAAARSVAVLQREYTKIYDATDPTTGRPLYSPEEKAKAKADFYNNVMEQAALGWFDGQTDKAGAYIKFTEGDFTINLNTPGADASRVIQNQEGAGKRKGPVDQAIVDKIAVAAAATGDNIQFRITSGGQPSRADIAAGRSFGAATRRTGSTRHDHGGAGDGVLVVDGRAVLPDEDPALYERFFENAAAAGLKGLGHYDWGIHVGGGSTAAWGPSTGSETLNPRFAAAIERGRKQKLDVAPSSTSIDVRKMLKPEKMQAIESEMRARINFRNTLADRQTAAEEKNLKAFQENVEFELTARVFGDGGTDPETGQPIEPVSREEIMERVRGGFINPDMGRSLIKALETEKPDRSDKAVLNDALRRLYADENIYNFVLENADKLSQADVKDLLSKNQSLNVGGDEGGMNKEATFHFNMLKDLLTPDSMMMKVDDGAEDRKHLALDEFRRRVKEGGEHPRDVAFDIRDRARLTFETLTGSKLDTMVRPRFSVQAESGRINLKESGRALIRAFEENRITADEFEFQKRALQQWALLQNQLDKVKAVK